MIDKLIKNKDLFKAFINQINCPLICISATGSIDIANDFALQLLQLDPQQYFGINIDEFCRQHNYSLFRLFGKHTTESIEEHYAVNKKTYHILWKLISFHKLNKEFNGSLLIGYDVTAYKSISQELNRKIFFYENILSKLPTNVYWKDRNCVYLGCNERLANVMGLSSRESVKGMTDFDFAWNKEAAKSFIAFDKKVMQSGIPLTTEDVFEEASGKVVTVLTNKTPLKNQAGETVGVLAISVDITELKHTQKQLEVERTKAEAEEAANQAKSEFIANMSHDLRTPMSGILGALENSHNILKTLLPQLKDQPETIHTPSFYNQLIQQLEIISTFSGGGYESSRALMDLFNNILETLQLESGRKLQESPEAFDLKALIQSVMQLVKSMALKKKIHCSLELEESVPHYLTGLPHPLSRTLLNLVNNALKFTKQGSVTVQIDVVDNEHKNSSYIPGDSLTLQIRVTDTGIGIPKDKFETIFEPFTLLTPSYRGLYQGSGLGLYAVKCYVEQMQGTIDVESELGKGSCFTVNLPLKVAGASDLTQNPEKPDNDTPSDSSVTETQEQQAPAPSSNKTTIATLESHQMHPDPDSPKKKATVLLVEDHWLIAEANQFHLRQIGCAVDIAATGQAALDQTAQKHYDLIFMDVGLPDKQGTEVTQELRESGWKGPIIGLTGHAKNPEYRKACFKAGMNEVIGKPVDDEILTPILQRWVWDQEQPQEQEAEPVKTQEAGNTTLPVIDWEKCLNHHNHNIDTVRNGLMNYAKELRCSQQLIEKTYKKQDIKALLTQLHHQEGALCYIKLPQLESAFKVFHKEAKQIPQNKERLEALYQRLQNAFDATLKILQSLK